MKVVAIPPQHVCWLAIWNTVHFTEVLYLIHCTYPPISVSDFGRRVAHVQRFISSCLKKTYIYIYIFLISVGGWGVLQHGTPPSPQMGPCFITPRIYSQRQTDTICSDFSKASDLVPLELLLRTRNDCGMLLVTSADAVATCRYTVARFLHHAKCLLSGVLTFWHRSFTFKF